MNTLLLDALNQRNHRRPPVWLMRQAGRYLPEYAALRRGRSFSDMVHNPELAAEVTLLPIKIFEMDAAILFSDILAILDALGVKWSVEEGVGPLIETPFATADDVRRLPSADVRNDVAYVAKAIRHVLPELNVPLIGFCGGPFTVASYLIEGRSSKDLKKTKLWMLRDPDSFHALLKHVTACSIAYLNMQIEAGVQAVQIFDTWANFLSHRHFLEFSLPYLKMLAEGVKETQVPMLVFSLAASTFAQEIVHAGVQGISFDRGADLQAMRRILPPECTLQGNLDPDILYADKKTVKIEVLRMLDRMRNDPGYIFNLGHGLKPDMPVDSVKVVVESVKTFKP